MGTAEHIRLVTPARSTSAEETSLSREVELFSGTSYASPVSWLYEGGQRQ